MGKRTFRNCRFYRSGDALCADMEVFKGKVMILRDIKTDRNDIYLIYCYLFWFLHSRGETP